MSSKSSSSTASTQQQISTTKDNSIIAEAGSINFAESNGNTINSTDQSTTVYNTLDGGAVGRSFDFAENVTKGAASLSVASVGAMSEFGRDALSAVKDAYGESSEGVQNAWQKAGSMMADNTKMSISAITSANENTNAQVADAYKGVTSALSDAWASSKAGEQKMLAFGMMAVVAFVAVKAVR